MRPSHPGKISARRGAVGLGLATRASDYLGDNRPATRWTVPDPDGLLTSADGGSGAGCDWLLGAWQLRGHRGFRSCRLLAAPVPGRRGAFTPKWCHATVRLNQALARRLSKVTLARANCLDLAFLYPSYENTKHREILECVFAGPVGIVFMCHDITNA